MSLNNINIILSAADNENKIKNLTVEKFLSYYSAYSVGIDHFFKSEYDLLHALNQFKNIIKPFPKKMDESFNAILYRGGKTTYPITLVKPGTRVSADTANVYNMFISELLPSWKKIPKRNKSIIFTNDYNSAEYYKNRKEVRSQGKGAEVYSVLPPNDALIVISPTKDIWTSFPALTVATSHANAGTPYFNELLLHIFRFLIYINNSNMNDKELKVFLTNKSTDHQFELITDMMPNCDIVKDMFERNISAVRVLIELFDSLVKNNGSDFYNSLSRHVNASYYGEGGILELLLFEHKRSGKFIKAIDVLLNFNINNFIVKKYSELSAEDLAKPHEMWTNSPCIFISRHDKQGEGALNRAFNIYNAYLMKIGEFNE